MARTLLEALQPLLRKLASTPRQARYAAGQALADTGFEIRKAQQTAMDAVFDRVTPFVKSGVRVRTPQALESLAQATRAAGLGSSIPGGDTATLIVDIDPTGRGKGPSQEQVLRAEVFGGNRGLKGAERRLQQSGLMLPGYAMVPSEQLLADSSKTDRHGNVKGPFIRSLLSYLQAFNTPGFTANAKASTLARLARRGRTGDRGPEPNARPGLPTINGVVYFISKGKGERTSAGFKGGREQHLPPGIWAKRGINGSNVVPVFLFTRVPSYRVRLRFEDIADLHFKRTFPTRYRDRLRVALANAK